MKKIKEGILYRRISQHVYVNVLTKKYYYVDGTESTPLTQRNCEEELQNLIERKIFLKNIINDRDTWVEFNGNNDVHFFKDIIPVSYTQSKKIRNIILNLNTTPDNYIRNKHINRQEKRAEFAKINEQILELESIYSTLKVYNNTQVSEQNNNDNVKQQINEVVRTLDIQMEDNATETETDDITTQDESLDNLVNNKNVVVIKSKKLLAVKTVINNLFSKTISFFKNRISLLKSKSQKQRLEKIVSQKSNKRLKSNIYYSIFGRNKWQEFIQTKTPKDSIETNKNKETVQYYSTIFPHNYYANGAIVGAGIAEYSNNKITIHSGRHFNENKNLDKAITHIFGEDIKTLKNEKLLKARSDIINKHQYTFENFLNNEQVIKQSTTEIQQLEYDITELAKKYKHSYYAYLSDETNDVNIDNLIQLLYLKKQVLENEYTILQCMKQNKFILDNGLTDSITNAVYNEPVAKNEDMSIYCKQYLGKLNTALVKKVGCINTDELYRATKLCTSTLDKINSFLRYFTTINKNNYETEKKNVKQLLRYSIVKALFLNFEDNKKNDNLSNMIYNTNIKALQKFNTQNELKIATLKKYDDLIDIVRSKYNERISALTPLFEKSQERQSRLEINKVLDQIINNEFKEVTVQHSR